MQKLFTYILFLFASVIVYGQAELRVKTDKRDYNGNEVIDLVIIVEMEADGLDKPIQLPDLSKFHIVGNSVTQSVYGGGNTTVTQVIHRFALEPKQSGKVRVGSALATLDGKIFKSEPFDIYVKEVPKKTIANSVSKDVFLNLEIEDRDVYQEQPAVCVVTAYSKNIESLQKVGNIKLPHSDHISVTPMHFDRSEIDPSGIGNMPSQVIAMFLLFPKESGVVDIPPVTASVNSYASSKKIASNPIKLRVKKLPEGAPDGFKNGVGDYKMTLSTLPNEQIEIEKPIDVAVKIAGVGNLSSLKLPMIESSPDYEVFPPKIVTHFLPKEKGIQGEITANYLVVPRKHGAISIKTENFSFFDPDKNEYVDEGPKILQVLTLSKEEALNARSAVERVNDYSNNVLETVNTPILKTTSLKIKDKDDINWKVILINISILLGAVFSFLLFKKWQRNRDYVADNVSVSPVGSVAETESQIRQVLKADIDDYFAYLKRILDDGNDDKFFQVAEELDKEVRNDYFQNTDDSFRSFLLNHKGNSVVEEYVAFKQKLQMAKYAPIKSREEMEDLYQLLTVVYSKISK